MKLSERLAALAEADQDAAKQARAPRRARTVKASATAPAGPKPARAVAGPKERATAPVGDGFAELKARVRAEVVKELGPKLSVGEIGEEELRERLGGHLTEALRSSPVTVGPSEREGFFDEVLADMLGWGPLESLMADPDVTEVMCNAHDEVYVERAGRIERTAVRFGSVADYRQVIDRMLAVAGRRIDDGAPMADGRLRDGSRINAIIPPLVVGEPVLTVRRFPEIPISINDLIRLESLSKDAAVFLEAAVRGKLNVVISGGTATGKTTLLNVLSNFIPDDDRVITIEDAAELRLNKSHVITLEARNANIEGAGSVPIRDLVRNALRMRPDRIVVGEVRGGEALDMLQAMNTGHEGSITTVHANSARDALARIETMVLFSGVDLPLRAVREQIVSSLDVIVHLSRTADGRRVVDLIAEVQGREGETVTMQDVFCRAGDSAPLRARGLRPQCLDKLARRGVTIPPAVFRPSAAPATKGRKR